MISYSHSYEDVVLARAFAGKVDGFYVDVGANHPVSGSVTKHFYDLGWSGVNIEPDVELAASLRAYRPRDVTLQVGASDTSGRLTFYTVVENGGLSTVSAEIAEEHRLAGYTVRTELIEVITLADVLAAHAARRVVDFLKVDVEGHEAAVLAGTDFVRFRPRVLVVESTRPMTNDLDHGWEVGVLDANYKFALFDGVNRYYARAEDAAELLPKLSFPANSLDGFVPHRQHELEEALQEYQSYGRAARVAARTVQRAVGVARWFFRPRAAARKFK